MTNLYKLIVTVLMTSPVIFGYRRFLDSRRQMKDRKFRNGEIREFRNLDPVYDFFLNQAFSKKPFVSEIHVMPTVYLIEGQKPSHYSSNMLVPPEFQINNKFDKQNTKNIDMKHATKADIKRPLVQLLNRADSDIGRALDKYMKNVDTKKVTDVVVKTLNPAVETSLPVENPITVPDNEAPPLKESFPVPSLKADPKPLGPGPYRFCFPPSVVVCGARLPWGHVVGMSGWCEQNCDKEAYTRHCDDARCTCKCLKPGDLF